MRLFSCFIFLFIVIQNISYGQQVNHSNAFKLDSVQKLLNTKHEQDTTRVKRLNEFAQRCFNDTLYSEGLEAAREARSLAGKLGYKKGPGLFYRTISFLMNTQFLVRYFDLKAGWEFHTIGQVEEKPVPEPVYYESDVTNRLDERLKKQLAALENNGDHEGAGYISFCLFFDSFNWGNTPEQCWQYMDNAVKQFKAANQENIAVVMQLYKMLCLQRAGKSAAAVENEPEVISRISKMDNNVEAYFLRFLLAYYYSSSGKPGPATETALRLNNEIEPKGMKNLQAFALSVIAVNFAYMSLPAKAVEYYNKAIALREELKSTEDLGRIYFNTGFELVALKNFDAAADYFKKAMNVYALTDDSSEAIGSRFRFADGSGQILLGKEQYVDALKKFDEANGYYQQMTGSSSTYIDFYIAQCQQKLNNLAESIKYGEKSYAPSLSAGDQRLTLKICNLLYEVYEQSGNRQKAYDYLKKYRALIEQKEEMDIANRSANLEIQAVIEKNQIERERLEKDKLRKDKQYQNQKWWLITIAGALLSAFVLLSMLFRNNRQKQKANRVLQEQKDEINIQKEKAEVALTDLKATQAQLIQSEKMASLGELTAGIAHEIQNPLNFVNNFSEVNKELLAEMKDEMSKGNLENAKSIANDLVSNEDKISMHGKRADAIVKSMLEHSRQGTGQKQPVDINVLADEYLKLAYHGLRPKDKQFNATMKTNLDSSIGKINVVAQDIGRVLLNLLNNAFWTVNEKQKNIKKEYEPMVAITTKRNGKQVEITITDNGNGIDKNSVDKIFQPFFTTKPTGQGTGLGLSLAYDIIKAHGGDIKVETTPGEGSKFFIVLQG